MNIFESKCPATHNIHNNSLINIIIQVITDWEPASHQYRISSILVSSLSWFTQSRSSFVCCDFVINTKQVHYCKRYQGFCANQQSILGSHMKRLGNQTKPSTEKIGSSPFRLYQDISSSSSPKRKSSSGTYHLPGMGVPHSYQPT